MMLALLVSACLKAAPAEIPPEDLPTCTTCHGSADRDDAAPPGDLGRDTGTDTIGVGAHQSHLHSTFSDPVPCEACHHVPAEIDDPEHIDTDGLPAELDFSGSVYPNTTYDPETHTCTGGCHDPDEAGNTALWTDVGAANCLYCHGQPPAVGHDPKVSNCTKDGCHSDGGSGPEHIDGRISLQ